MTTTPRGECFLTSIYSLEKNCYEIRIDRADPHILIADQLLHQAFFGPDSHPQFSLRGPTEGHGSIGHTVGQYDCWAPPGGVCFYGSVATLAGINQTVIYRIGQYDTGRHAWHASWPDHRRIDLLKAAIAQSRLPDQADRTKISAWMTTVQRAWWAEENL